ncbi:1-deoxy-D-xylulose-5-phosphate synthase N-terminal domain-containing protein [Streptomyces ipomoeae]|uniref:1-deoxy-D-xylulose-5-phosphate synthase N-terminal domain-containing protein n=1 Tax=Streptomyces ipomoeae TaxID=103232 RepID=UPI0011461CBF|nr:1-deoxy-D-xylulose-5-phosphate synthase N-terminal domain-containing protein [Streptomyces ipomoeae]MDX2938369.1 1-deoxy-D-xylulose-5-phosphate synthase N-terminal domain-containing protein [Streptomyces ipomoeae]TQE22071.1 transketolase [Streptomyces ipomoeae]
MTSAASRLATRGHTSLLGRFADEARASLPRLTPDEAAAVERELAAWESLTGPYPTPLAELAAVAAAVPERLYDDSAQVLLRMHEIAGSGNHQSCLSSLPLVRACFDLGLVPDANGDTGFASATRAELIVGRGHIAPSFYAERYVRGTFPFTPLTTLHRDGLTGVVHRTWGFGNTMRYSLGVGVAQAVSLAWELRRRGEQRKVVCLAGDGELHEGVTFECLRFAHEAGLDNLVLVVDANGKGIEPLRAPVSREYLSAYLGTTMDADGQDSESVGKALGELLEAPGSGLLLCATRKEGHSFKPPADPSAPPPRPSFAAGSGRLLAGFQQATDRQLAVFTGDMAARFGLAGAVAYENVGLAETLSIGLTLSLPDDTVKVVATDAMYYMDSLSMLTEATTSTRNLLVLAGRSWGAWGGASNALNLLDRIMNTRCYEPVTAAEFTACATRLLTDPATTHVLSMVDARFTEPGTDCSADIDGAVWITPPGADGAKLDHAVISFGYASVLVEEANRELGLPHLHCAALRPRLNPALTERLRRCRSLLSVEYNGVSGGFGEGLRARHLLPLTVHGVTGDILNCVHDKQLARHGMATAQLTERLRELRDPLENGAAA